MASGERELGIRNLELGNGAKRILVFFDFFYLKYSLDFSVEKR